MANASKPPHLHKAVTVRARITAKLAAKAAKRLKQFGSWSEYLRALIKSDVGEIKEL